MGDLAEEENGMKKREASLTRCEIYVNRWIVDIRIRTWLQSGRIGGIWSQRTLVEFLLRVFKDRKVSIELEVTGGETIKVKEGNESMHCQMRSNQW